MKKFFISLFFSIAILSYSAAFAVEVAPRISDREIIEGLADIRGDIKKLEAKVEGDIKELKAGQIALQQQINDLRELIKWMLGILISISFTVMMIMGRILWNQQKKLTEIETSLKAQKEEISFLKILIEKLQILIEKLLPPRGVL
ncbi:MAG TPA: hypothetical protein DCQ99_02755 [Nitrospinae bacterium]|nr:hypothetical protein [Nitrospinota bacterium]HBA26514.1 hypothetical protein [Nitrospinota bacterium]